MRTLLAFLLFASAIAAFAIGPEYSSLREWVEKHNTKDQTPSTERVFVNFLWEDSAIVRYHSGMTIQEVIAQTQFRDRSVRVSIFRATHKPAGEPVYDELLMKKPNRADFVVQALDVLWLEDTMSNRN
jgi:hypothetical protein